MPKIIKFCRRRRASAPRFFGQLGHIGDCPEVREVPFLFGFEMALFRFSQAIVNVRLIGAPLTSMASSGVSCAPLEWRLTISMSGSALNRIRIVRRVASSKIISLLVIFSELGPTISRITSNTCCTA